MDKSYINLILVCAQYATDHSTINCISIIIALLELSYNVVRNYRRNGTISPLQPICYKVNQN